MENYYVSKEQLQIEKFNCDTSMLHSQQLKINANNEEEYSELKEIVGIYKIYNGIYMKIKDQ